MDGEGERRGEERRERGMDRDRKGEMSKGERRKGTNLSGGASNVSDYDLAWIDGHIMELTKACQHVPHHSANKHIRLPLLLLLLFFYPHLSSKEGYDACSNKGSRRYDSMSRMYPQCWVCMVITTQRSEEYKCVW